MGNMEAAKTKPSSIGYVSFDKTPAADGGLKMTRQHHTRTIPATDAPYRRLLQHDYGRRRRLSRSTDRTRFSRSGDDRITEKTRNRVKREVTRVKQERGSRTSSVDASMRGVDTRMRQSTRERERSTPVIPRSRDSVTNVRAERTRETPARTRSRSTERTGRDVIREREPEIKDCRDTENEANTVCGSCATNYRVTPPTNASCPDICRAKTECDKKITTISREVERVGKERSVSLTPERPPPSERGSGRVSDRGSSRPEPRAVQTRPNPRADPREDPRDRGDDSGAAPERDPRGDSGASTRGDVRVRENAERMIKERYATPPDP